MLQSALDDDIGTIWLTLPLRKARAATSSLSGITLLLRASVLMTLETGDGIDNP